MGAIAQKGLQLEQSRYWPPLKVYVHISPLRPKGEFIGYRHSSLRVTDGHILLLSPIRFLNQRQLVLLSTYRQQVVISVPLLNVHANCKLGVI